MKSLERSWLEGLARGLDPEPPPDEFAEDRERCRSLSAFIEGAWHAIEPATPYLPNWHIDCMSEHLEAVTAGEILRLLINIPPRNMKSIECSVMWPVWEWREAPWLRYMFVTYASELSKEHSDMRRAVLASPWFRARWGGTVRVVKDDVFNVRNDRRGVFQATSFGGTATGKGANRLVFDDPHNPKQAESDLERKATVRDFGLTFGTRLNDKKRDAIVVVMQRLHEDDVAAECERLGYVKLCLPAEAEGRTVVRFPRSGREVVREDGSLLWPDREGRAELDAVRGVLGSYGYAGQYQQRPAPAGGGLFKPGWFTLVSEAPASAKRVRFWDLAGTKDGDWTVGVRMARTQQGVYYVENVVRGRWAPMERDEVIVRTAEADGQECEVGLEQEPGSSGKGQVAYLTIALAGFVVFSDRPTGSKRTRAMAFAAQAEAGNVRLVKADWNGAYLDELAVFDNGKYDDQVDGSSGAFNKLALMLRPIAGVPVPAVSLPPVPSWSAVGPSGQGIPQYRG